MYLAQFPRKAIAMHESRVDAVLPKLRQLSTIIVATEVSTLKEVFQHASYIDRWHVYEMANFFGLELCGIQSQNLREMRLPKITKSVEIASTMSLEWHAEEAARRSQSNLSNSMSDSTPAQERDVAPQVSEVEGAEQLVADTKLSL